MLFQVENRINEDVFLKIESSPEKEIEFDLSLVKFLTSKELSRLLILSRKNGKQIILIHPNEHIKETIYLLGFEKFFSLRD